MKHIKTQNPRVDLYCTRWHEGGCVIFVLVSKYYSQMYIILNTTNSDLICHGYAPFYNNFANCLKNKHAEHLHYMAGNTGCSQYTLLNVTPLYCLPMLLVKSLLIL